MKKRRVLIIGGASYIGKNLLFSLSNINHIVATYNRNEISLRNIPSYYVDLTQPHPFSSLIENEAAFDILIWSVQAEQYRQNLASYKNLVEVNIMGLQKTLDFCRKNGIKKFIYLSSGSVYPQSASPLACDENALMDLKSYYGFSKYVGEQMCYHYSLENDIKFSCLRLFTVYGPFQKNKVIPNIWDTLKSTHKITLNSGIGMRFSALYIEDLCRIVGKLIDLDWDREELFEIYNVASPEVVELKDVCQEIGRLEQKKISIFSNDLPVTFSLANSSKLIKKINDISFHTMKKGLSKMFETEHQICAE